MSTEFTDYENWRWRTGRKAGRTIYAIVHEDEWTPSDNDVLIGMMDSRELAAEAVQAHNRDHDIRASR